MVGRLQHATVHRSTLTPALKAATCLSQTTRDETMTTGLLKSRYKSVRPPSDEDCGILLRVILPNISVVSVDFYTLQLLLPNVGGSPLPGPPLRKRQRRPWQASLFDNTLVYLDGRCTQQGVH